MPIKLENVAIAVRDLDATIAFFTDLGLEVLGRDEVSGEWSDTAVGRVPASRVAAARRVPPER